jgi:hypothetical protein
MTEDHAPLLQLTDQTNMSSLGWIPTVPSKDAVICERTPKAEQHDNEEREPVIKKNLMTDFDESMHTHKKSR